IEPDCIYGSDEVGFSTSLGQKERVIGGKGKTVQHQVRDGNRENITVIPTICADGTAIPPLVIFKGKAFQVKWSQDNPLNASIGYSQKGWTDGEIGIEWIKHFDLRTKAKARGRPQLLLVDGHNSHYTLAFLLYAIAAHILVLCYGSHTTHVYQGLDVVVFGILKTFWREERDRWEREGNRKVTKENFIVIYSRAWIRTATPEVIKSAFEKTGVWPLNRNRISAKAMAPSRETSYRGSLLFTPPSPVR
ncbi:CENP-B protein, partial [Lentinus tigrinus ALCF2SS1-7]|uniref:CENP-B protein n=1 Tax=Lentinus tigrinus ALCF2SS1-7 TaxID=1328758 RepID=UPI001166046E